MHALVLIRPFSAPRTSSGKIKRFACRRGWLDGTHRVIGEWRAAVEPAVRSVQRPVEAGQRPAPSAKVVEC